MDDFLRPETVDKVRRFLGMLNFYRSCIPRASGISAALNKVLKGLLANDKKIPLNLDARRKSCTTKQQKTGISSSSVGFFSSKGSNTEKSYSTNDWKAASSQFLLTIDR